MSADLPSVFQPLHPDDPREVGGYRLFARLGAGGMGRVYLSYTPGGRPVALKVVRPEFAEDGEFRRRFAQEVTSAQRIHGLYTAQVIDSGADADAPWLVTAYVPGPSLQQVIREHGALPVRTVLLLIGGIAEALQAIHSVQVVHRDLKPANVLVAADGPRVIDFGIARAADATALTGTGFRIGSPAFMSPEQAQGRPVTPATDVFALGALAAYAVGGTPPFGEGPETAVLYRVVHEQPDLGNVPADLRGLLERCLAKQPEDRPAPAELIDAARSHPEVGGQLRFSDDWLPAPVGTEITRRSDLPRTPPTPLPAPPAGPPTLRATAPSPAAPPPPAGPPAGAVAPPLGAFGPPQAPVGAPAPHVPPAAYQHPHPGFAATVPRPAPHPGPVPARRGGVGWRTVLGIAAATAVAGTLVGVLLTDGDDPAGGAAGQRHPTAQGTAPGAGTGTGRAPAASGESAGATGAGGSAAAAPGGTYTELYRDRELASPDYTYLFDLSNGKVVSSSTYPAWALEPTYGHFNWSSGSDVYFDKQPRLTPAACTAGIEQQPLTELKYDDLPVGRLFCVRNRESGDVVVAKVVEQGRASGAARVSLTYYRNDA
ncbi:serine/threonine-protein kinase [Kitasatospora sp. NBC_01539]|uniref:serine/threonine-protein kinase n=1 Tax=Kitasatospora sp. NBC_01539 TaxID=2903577 RepID=UPI00386014E3